MFIILLLLLLSTICVSVYRRFSNTHYTSQIPYAYSIHSSRHTILSRLQGSTEYIHSPISFLQKQHQRFGNIFCVDLIVTRLVFCVGEDWTEKILRADDKLLNFGAMIRLVVGGEIAKILDFKPFAIPNYKIIRSGLLSSTRINRTLTDTSPFVYNTLNAWCDQPCINLLPSLYTLLINIVVEFFVGPSFASRHSTQILSYCLTVAETFQNPMFIAFPPQLRGFTPAGRRLQKAIDEMKELMIEEIQKFHNGDENFQGRSDYFTYSVHLYDQEIAEKAFGVHFLMMMFGSMANLPLTLFWLMVNLAQNPKDMERLRKELEPLREDHLESMDEGKDKVMNKVETPFFEACFKEIGRMYSNVAMSRLCIQDCNFFGLDIRRNTVMTASAIFTHYDETYFKDPYIFNPSRHLTTFASTMTNTNMEQVKINEIKGNSNMKSLVVQFSIGPHSCPGEKFARSIVKSMIKKMIEYDWIIVDDGEQGTNWNPKTSPIQPAWSKNVGTPDPVGKVNMAFRKRRGKEDRKEM